MLEIKYYRDYGHNYMILRCERRESADSYGYKILTSGKIPDILACSVRHINGAAYYYYDISSRTTLANMYRSKKMSYGEVKDVLLGLCRIRETLSGYFMDEAGLLLLPEHIYYDLTNRKYIGLYYPDYDAADTGLYKPLVEFLLEHIDTEDRKLADNIYRICEIAEERFFSLEEALRILEEDEEEAVVEAPVASFDPVERKMPAADTAEFFDVMQEQPDADPPKAGHSSGRNLFYPIFAILSVLGIAGAAAVCTLYELTQQERLVLYGAAAAMGACLLFCLVGIFAGGRRKKAAAQEGDASAASARPGEWDPQRYFDREPYREPGKVQAPAYTEYEALPPLDRVIDKNPPVLKRAEREPAPYGNTVFFDGRDIVEYKLYAMDRKNKKHIDLQTFPCTVGKMAGCVDFVLSDASVSRIHARFDKEGDKLLLTDMNSTNGTYKNGLRMQPQETVEIEPGDEIRFGSLNYCYR